MVVLIAKRLTAAFALAALGGCATMNYTGTQDCVERNGYQFNVPLMGSISKRNDKFSEECATARVATVISTMRKRDGTPDMNMYNLALSLYEQSNTKMREFMEKMLKEEGTSIADMKFTVAKESGQVMCERVSTTNPDGTVTTGFRCKDAAAAALK